MILLLLLFSNFAYADTHVTDLTMAECSGVVTPDPMSTVGYLIGDTYVYGHCQEIEVAYEDQN